MTNTKPFAIAPFTSWPQGPLKHFKSASDALAQESVPARTLELIRLHSSALNKCAFCLAMHSDSARKLGITEPEIFAVTQSGDFVNFPLTEQAALRLTRSLTLMADHDGIESDIQAALAYFSKTQIAVMVQAIAIINGWNRMAVANGLTHDHFADFMRHGQNR